MLFRSNEDPKFFNANSNKLVIEAVESAAYQKGDPFYGLLRDVLGHPRTSMPPDLGAYQSIVFPDPTP